MGRIDDDIASDVHPDVARQPAWTGVGSLGKEQIPGSELSEVVNRLASEDLVVGDARESDPGGGVRLHHQPRTVVANRSDTTPNVRLAQLGHGILDRRHRRLGRARRERETRGQGYRKLAGAVGVGACP